MIVCSDNSIIMLTDNIVMVGLISNNNVTAHLDKVEGLPGEKTLSESFQDQGDDCELQEDSTTITN